MDRPATPPRHLYSEAARPSSVHTHTVLDKAVLDKAISLLQSSRSTAREAQEAGVEDSSEVRPSTSADASYQRWRNSLNMHLGIAPVSLPPLPRTPHPRSPKRTPVLSIVEASSEIVGDDGRMDGWNGEIAAVSVHPGHSNVQAKAAVVTARATEHCPGPSTTAAPTESTSTASPWEAWLESRRNTKVSPMKSHRSTPDARARAPSFNATQSLPPPSRIPPVSFASSSSQPRTSDPKHSTTLHAAPTFHQSTNEASSTALRQHAGDIDPTSTDEEDSSVASAAVIVDPDIQDAYDRLFEEARVEIASERHASSRAEQHDTPAACAQSTALVPSPQRSLPEESEGNDDEIDRDDTPLQAAYGILDNFRDQRNAIATEHLLLTDSPPRLQRRRHVWPKQSSSRARVRHAKSVATSRESQRNFVNDDDVENLAENIRSWRVPSPKKKAKRRSRQVVSSVNINRSMPFSATPAWRSSSSSTLTVRNKEYESNGLGWLKRAVQPSEIRGGVLDLSVSR